MAKERLVRAGEVKAKLIEIRNWFGGPVQTEQDRLAQAVVNMCIEEIDKLKAVDAVEVVRCKDCKKWNSETGSCEEFTTHRFPAGGRITFLTRENDFCSYGERKDNG